MKERERVLELVKKGIITSEEALVLLENMATEKDEKQIKKVADQVNTSNIAASAPADHEENNPTEAEGTSDETTDTHPEKDYDAADRENLEKILDELGTKANQTSAEIDEVNAEIAGIKVEIKEAQERLMELNTKEELSELSEAEVAERLAVETSIRELEAALAEHKIEKTKVEAALKSIRKEQWQEAKEKVASKLEIPEDWKEQAEETFNQVGEKVTEVGSQVGSFFKKTIHSLSDAMNDNIEWKDLKVKVPSVATTKFDHEFNYPNPQASLIDVKVANGNVVFKTWDQPDVKVEANIKLYGKMSGDSPMEAFLEKSHIDVDDETITFQVPNKRVRADLTFYLPERTYDHVAIKLLNGNITIDSLKAKDVYTKSTNGAITFKQIDATMLEVEGVNGELKVLAGTILDTIIETVNGNIIVTATPQNISASLINGDVKITAKEDTLRKIEATSANGNIKVALPAHLSVEGLAKTHLGSIQTRLNELEIVRDKKERGNQLLQFRRINDEVIAHIHASTTTGNILFKDTDQ